VFTQKIVDKTVFRTYDIRGIIGEQLDENAFYSIGKALSCRLAQLNRRHVYLARDGRLSSARLASALQQGLIESGIHVFDLGEVATPVMYFATHVGEYDSGLMVTGSHNPADYNGIKMLLAGTTLAEGEIQALYHLVEAGSFVQGIGEYTRLETIDTYINRMLADITLKRPLKLVVDCGNGVAGPVVVRVLSALGCEVIPLYCEVDGRFPNHHPDPSDEANLEDLKAAVLAEDADLGLAFDGDADRLGVVTEKAEVIWPDRLLILYARALLARKKDATIVYDVKCTSHLKKSIEEAGGVAIMSPTGHSLVKRIMRESDAALAGEMSGHVFFKDRWYGFDDALYSACRLLEILSQSSLSVSHQFALIPDSVNTPEIKIPIAETQKFEFMRRFIAEASFEEGVRITIDGLRVEFPDGWGLLRASNTSPCLVARFEAVNDESLRRIRALFDAQIKRIGLNA
jgi:phosphomannomutase/phosphoglucomutase